MLLTYFSHHSHTHTLNYGTTKYGYTYVTGNLERTRYFQYFGLTYLEKKRNSKSGWDYSSRDTYSRKKESSKPGEAYSTKLHIYTRGRESPKPGWAYSSSYKRELSQKAAAVFQSLGNKVRACFSRDFKPIDHLGGLDPEKRLLLIDDRDRGVERWPKTGSTFENMDVCVY